MLELLSSRESRSYLHQHCQTRRIAPPIFPSFPKWSQSSSLQSRLLQDQIYLQRRRTRLWMTIVISPCNQSVSSCSMAIHGISNTCKSRPRSDCFFSNSPLVDTIPILPMLSWCLTPTRNTSDTSISSMYFHWPVRYCNYELVPTIIRNTAVVPVVVDPVIASKLCPCQCQGITFMYESVMGLKDKDAFWRTKCMSLLFTSC